MPNPEQPIRNESRIAPVPTTGVVTQSEKMRRLVAEATRAAASSASILLTGESGTGKELFAKIIHQQSSRSDQNYVCVNCAALSGNLVESELFGHEKGAFTDAIGQRIGRFEYANGGTLLLDEVTEIPLATQAKLLRVLEENEFQRVGNNESLATDVRIVATSNRDIQQFCDAGQFRLDLFHRLRVIELKIPPLRERTIDIAPLSMHFLQRFRSESTAEARGFTRAALQKLSNHSWPGNIRELRNAIHRACVVADGPLIDADSLELDEPAASTGETRNVPDSWLRVRLAEIERRVILASISHYGSKTAAAKYLGVTTRTLSNKLKLYSADDAECRDAA